MPSSSEARNPHGSDSNLLVEKEEKLRWNQKVTPDCCHRTWNLLPALPGDLVLVPDRREQGTVGDEIAPQSYEVETPSGTFRGNRRNNSFSR